MKIIHVLNTNKFSGAEKVVIEIIKQSSPSDEIYYCSPKGTIQKELKKNNIKYLSISSLKSKKEFKKIVHQINPDIIHAHDIRATFFSVLYSKKVPIISHLHGNSDPMKKLSLKSLMYLYSSYFVNHIIAVSKSTLNDYKFSKNIKSKTSVLYNFVDKENLLYHVNLDKKEYNYDFVYLGRISYEKNPQKIAEIASLILKQSKILKFAVIGDGPLKDRMEKIFVEQGVNDQVDFLGFVENPYKILKSSKCMIMCSKFEGTPMVAIEALHLNVPIVSYPTDGLLELIIHGKNGYFAENEIDFVNYVNKILRENKINNNKQNHLVTSEEYIESLNKIYFKALI